MAGLVDRAPSVVSADDRGAAGPAAAVSAAHSLVEALRQRGETLALAESCTGGLIGSLVTRVPGASEVFWGGAVSYCDTAKQRLLGVSAHNLQIHGAVSEQVAREMAVGARALAGTVWALAVTGIAGPGGATPEKAAGSVWLAVAGGHAGTRFHQFEGDREAVRMLAAREALEWLLRLTARGKGNQ